MAYYPPEYVERIALIKRLQEERFMPLRVIKGALEEDPERVRALIELEDRILERALATVEDRGRDLAQGRAGALRRYRATCSSASRRSACSPRPAAAMTATT